MGKSSLERAQRAKKKQELIRAEYDSDYKKGLRREIIVKKLADKYFLSENTVNAMIWKTAHYHEKKEKPKGSQLNLFGE